MRVMWQDISKVLILAVSTGAIIAFTACSKEDKGNANAKVPSVPVVVSKVVQKDMPVQLRAVGTVEAYSTVTIKPQLHGILTKVHFKEGQDVKRGDLLFTNDPRPYQAELAQAQANLAKNVAQAKNAREQANRYEGLVKKDYVTKEQYDQMKANADALEAAANADRAAVENARLLLNYCTIRSPIDGRTGNLLVHEGNVVKENDTIMVDIHQIHPIYVRFSVPEENLPDIKRYNSSGSLKVQATPQGQKNAVQGKLSFIDNAVDAATGTILLKGSFENNDGGLWPGQFVDVNMILTTRPNALVVPSQAVETGQQGQFVFVVKADMTAEQRNVIPGFSVNQETVIEKGLEAGEMVVTDGQLRLLPGSKVEIKSAEKRAAL